MKPQFHRFLRYDHLVHDQPNQLLLLIGCQSLEDLGELPQRRHDEFAVNSLPVDLLHRSIQLRQRALVAGSDLDRLIRLEAFLNNEPDSRQEIVIGELRGNSDEDLRQMLCEDMALLKGIGIEEKEPQEMKP